MKTYIIMSITIAILCTPFMLNAGSYGDFQNDAYTVALYYFEGDALDETANNNDGTINGATSMQFGKFGQAYSYDGNDYITTTSTELATASEFTVELWFKANSTVADQMLWWQGKVSGNGWGYQQEAHLTIGDEGNDDYVIIYMGSGSTDVEANCSTPFVDTASWHYIAGVFENLATSATVTLYVDGEEVCSDDNGAAISRDDWNTGAIFGKPGVDTRYFSGYFDSARLSDVARTTQEIRQYYAQSKGAYGIIEQ